MTQLPIELDCWLIKWGFHEVAMVPQKEKPPPAQPGWRPETYDEEPPF